MKGDFIIGMWGNPHDEDDFSKDDILFTAKNGETFKYSFNLNGLPYFVSDRGTVIEKFFLATPAKFAAIYYDCGACTLPVCLMENLTPQQYEDMSPQEILARKTACAIKNNFK